jgi:ABC-type antimicrobial peptide transport system permease subunit
MGWRRTRASSASVSPWARSRGRFSSWYSARLPCWGWAAWPWGCAVALSRLIANRLYGMSALDPGTYLVAVALLFGIALLASYLPARAATRVDPLVALRTE